MQRIVNVPENSHPEAVFSVLRNFHWAMNKVFPKYYQHIICPTRGEPTQDHCYTHSDAAPKPSPTLQHSKVQALPNPCPIRVVCAGRLI